LAKFPFWLSEKELDYIISAVEFVADHGWKFLPLYKYNPKTGEWAHLTRMTKFPDRKWLSTFNLSESESGSGNGLTSSDLHSNAPIEPPITGIAAAIAAASDCDGGVLSSEQVLLSDADIVALLDAAQQAAFMYEVC